jgi:hypothetical protein
LEQRRREMRPAKFRWLNDLYVWNVARG